MKNLMKQIATSLSLALMMASLVVISPDQAQAKGKKKAGNTAKAKSQAKRSGSNAKVSMQDIHFSRAKVNSQANSSGSNANRLHLEDVSLGRKAKGDNLTDILVTGATANSQAKKRRRRTGIGNGGASYDIRRPIE